MRLVSVFTNIHQTARASPPPLPPRSAPPLPPKSTITAASRSSIIKPPATANLRRVRSSQASIAPHTPSCQREKFCMRNASGFQFDFLPPSICVSFLSLVFAVDSRRIEIASCPNKKSRHFAHQAAARQSSFRPTFSFVSPFRQNCARSCFLRVDPKSSASTRSVCVDHVLALKTLAKCAARSAFFSAALFAAIDDFSHSEKTLKCVIEYCKLSSQWLAPNGFSHRSQTQFLLVYQFCESANCPFCVVVSNCQQARDEIVSFVVDDLNET